MRAMLSKVRSLTTPPPLFRRHLASSSDAATALPTSSSSIVDLERYPIDDLDTAPARALLERARRDLAECGCASFPGFLTERSILAAANEARSKASDAFVTNDWHNAYQLPESNPKLPERHVRNVAMNTRVASTAYDELATDGVLKRLYNDPRLVRFVGAVTDRSLYPLADPLGAASINVFQPSWSHAWHFDESEFTTTLCLQRAETGGSFEFSPRIRDTDADLASDACASLINANSSYSVVGDTVQALEPPVHPITTADFDAGTLQIFAGRYSLHRVTNVGGSLARLVAVLCFSAEPGYVNSASVQKMFWGRVANGTEPPR